MAGCADGDVPMDAATLVRTAVVTVLITVCGGTGAFLLGDLARGVVCSWSG